MVRPRSRAAPRNIFRKRALRIRDIATVKSNKQDRCSGR